MKHTSLFRILSVLLAVLMLLAVSGCSSDNKDFHTPGEWHDDTSTTEAATQAPVDPKDVTVRVMVLSGTTGFSMAPMIAGREGSELNLQFTVENDASVIMPALINGTCDIAALPTNAAAVLYNKKPGLVRVMAVNTLGVLYLVTSSDVTVNSFEDLKGMTVYCPAQNPAYIFSALCSAFGVEPNVDMFIDTTYAQPAELRTALVTGKVKCAVLPEPMVTIARAANDSLKVALDLNAAWEGASGGEFQLMQGCVVVRTEFAMQYPELVEQFLTEYEASVNAVIADPAAAGQAIVDTGIFSNAVVAAAAIPNCNLCFVTGKEMAAGLDSFYRVIGSVTPDAIGGYLPNSFFYYGVDQ